MRLLSWVVLCLWLGAFGRPASSSVGSQDDPPSVGIWTWVENCHVQRGHTLTDFGTSGSLLVEADNQTLVSNPSAGKNRTGFTYIGTAKQDIWSGGSLIGYLEGGTSYTLDGVIRNSLGTNGAVEPADAYLSRFFLLQNFAGDRLQVALGRIVASDYFDTNRAACCELSQFLSRSLVNNPAIPFPQAGLGIAARLAPAPWLYVQAGGLDAGALATRADFGTFHARSDIFGILEFGVSPFPDDHAGTYRFLLWYSPRSGSSPEGSNHGTAVSFDQSITDRLTLFFRHGWTDAPINNLTGFASAGATLTRPLPDREHDVLLAGLAWGNGTLHDETLLEVGYRLQLTDSLAITPLTQIITDPAQNPRGGTFVVAGVRAVYVF